MLKYFILIYFVAVGIAAKAVVRDSLLKVTFEELSELQCRERRPVLVFIQASWCSYCKAMEQSVFKHPEVIKKLNRHFYTVYLDAESQDGILFSGRLFSFKPTGKNIGIHELAEELASVEGKISYPALCILNADNEIIFQYQGFLNRIQLLEILTVLENN